MLPLKVEVKPGRLIVFHSNDAHEFVATSDSTRAMLGPVAFHEGKPQLCKMGCNWAGLDRLFYLVQGSVAGAWAGVALHSAGLSPVGYALGGTETGVAGPMLLIACGVAATVAVAAIDGTKAYGMAGFAAGGTVGSLFGDGINAVVSSLFSSLFS